MLDLVITDTYDIIDDIDILSPLGKSDHAILNIKCQSIMHMEDNSTSKFNYGKGDYEKLRNSLDIDWVHVFNSFGNEVDKMWDYFKNELLLNVQKYIPVASNFRQWKKPLWKCPVSVNLQGLIKKKSRLWKRFIETRNPQTHKEYKKVLNEIRKQTRLIIKKNSVKLQNNANLIQRNFGNMSIVRQEKMPTIISESISRNSIAFDNFSAKNPQEICHKVFLSTSPVKCSHYIPKIQKAIFSNTLYTVCSRLQLDKFLHPKMGGGLLMRKFHVSVLKIQTKKDAGG